MEISAEFKGIWMTRELVLSDLNIYEEKLLSIIWALDKIGTRGCDAGNKYLAKFMKGVKPTRISNILSSLIKQGHLKRTVVYKPGSKEIDKRYLKVISPLLLTMDRVNSDPYLSSISGEKQQPTPFTENEYPIHSEKNTHSLRVNTPFTESERYNIVNNIKDNNIREKGDFSEKIGGVEEGFSIDTYCQLWSITPTDSVLNNIWYNLSQEEKEIVSNHLPKYLSFNPVYRTTPRNYLRYKKWLEPLQDRRPQAKTVAMNNPTQIPPSTTKYRYVN